MLAVLFQRGVPSPCCWTAPFLGEGTVKRGVCARARVVFGACTPPGSLKVGNTLSAFPAPRRPGSALPGADGERGSPPSRQGVLRAVSASSKVGAEAGPGAGKLGSGGWTQEQPPLGGRDPAPLGAPGLPRGCSETPGEEERGGAGLSQAASCPGI